MSLIYANDGVHAVLRKGEVPVVGKISVITKRLIKDRGMVPCREIWFDWHENGAIDRFFWENDKLVYHSIDMTRDEHMILAYQEILEHPEITRKQFINAILKVFILKEMGFTI